MQDAGITPPDAIIADGEINRFHIAGDKHGTLNGAYTLHLDGRPAGYFEDLKRGIKCTWKQSGPFMPLTDFQRQAFAKQRQAFAKQRQADEIQRQAEEAAKHKKAASKAVYIWNHAPPAPANYPYLIKKRIGNHGARLGRDNMLVIPLYDENGVLTSLQFVNEDGAKRLLKDGRVQGSFCTSGKLQPGGTILICEGWATGASLYEATGYFTVVAFSAGNLTAVAMRTRKRHPDCAIIICGDNDESGLGQKAAREAALAIGGKYILPTTVGHDWNDSINAEVCHG
jgi:putative DNA primase/helicase